MIMDGLEKDLDQPYHQAFLKDDRPMSIVGGISHAKRYMYLVRMFIRERQPIPFGHSS